MKKIHPQDKIYLYSHVDNCEGIILLDDTGQHYVNQTGGVSCNQQKAVGNWIPKKIPEIIQSKTCCRFYSKYDVNDQHDLDEINVYFKEAGIAFQATDGEEAWLQGFYNSQPAIATWWNCD